VNGFIIVKSRRRPQPYRPLSFGLKIGDGSAPEDNPYVGQEGALPELYSIGTIGTFKGLIYDTEGQRVWLNEHGPRGGDENQPG